MDVSNKLVLIVDAETSLLQALNRLFGSSGFEVTTARTPEEAMSFDRAPDFALIDVMLHGMNGVDLARKLAERWGSLQIVFITDGCPIELRQQAEKIGPILGKPFVYNELLGVVDHFIDLSAKPVEATASAL